MARAIRNLLRLFGVGWTLARFGALFPLEQLHHAPALGVLARLSLVVRRRDHGRLRPGERLAAALVALGPSFIKFGQSLATRSDLIGDDISRDLSRLQDKLPPFSHALAKATVEDELEASLADSFLSFDETPVAAASIAQVHYAVTPDGAEVAVKVLRPGIEASFARDIDLFRWIAGVMETHLALGAPVAPRRGGGAFRRNRPGRDGYADGGRRRRRTGRELRRRPGLQGAARGLAAHDPAAS